MTPPIASTSGARVARSAAEQAADQEVPLGGQHRLLAVDVEVALRAGRERDLALLVGEALQQREQPAALRFE